MICSRVERRVARARTGSVHGVGKTSRGERFALLALCPLGA
jgi:hypothetical protein